MYHVGVGLTTNMKVQATKWVAENADAMGIHSIWIGEDIGIGQDPFILAASCLIHTRTVRVGTGIVPISVHNLSTLARAALSLHEIGQGRFVFGTGIGGLQDLTKLGIVLKKPVSVLRQALDSLRALWAGDTVSLENELFVLDGYSLKTSDAKIPIFLGVRGPQMLRLVGESADGAILSGPIDYLRYAVREIDQSAKKSGRDPNTIEKVAWLPTIPTFKGEKESLAKKVVAIVVADMPESIIDMLSVDREKVDLIKNAVAKDGPKAGIEYIDDEIIDTFAIAGGLTHMVDVFERVASVGITEVLLGPPFSGDWRSAMTEILHEIEARRQWL